MTQDLLARAKRILLSQYSSDDNIESELGDFADNVRTEVRSCHPMAKTFAASSKTELAAICKMIAEAMGFKAVVANSVCQGNTVYILEYVEWTNKGTFMEKPPTGRTTVIPTATELVFDPKSGLVTSLAWYFEVDAVVKLCTAEPQLDLGDKYLVDRVSAFFAAVKDGDASSAASLFAENAVSKVFSQSPQPVPIGREAIGQGLQQYLDLAYMDADVESITVQGSQAVARTYVDIKPKANEAFISPEVVVFNFNSAGEIAELTWCLDAEVGIAKLMPA